MKLEYLNNMNPWWKYGADFWKYDRNLKEIKNAPIEFKRKKIQTKKGNIYILRGSRQSGKTIDLWFFTAKTNLPSSVRVNL